MTTTVRILLGAAVRSGALALGLLAYDAAYDALVTNGPDADIGKGLIALGLIALACLGWGVCDGLRQTAPVWSGSWLVAASALGIGWELVGGGPVEWELVLFTAQLVAAPALVAAALAWAVARQDRRRTAGA